MCYTHRWTSRGSYRLISDRTCGKIAPVLELVYRVVLETIYWGFESLLEYKITHRKANKQGMLITNCWHHKKCYVCWVKQGVMTYIGMATLNSKSSYLEGCVKIYIIITRCDTPPTTSLNNVGTVVLPMWPKWWCFKKQRKIWTAKAG